MSSSWILYVLCVAVLIGQGLAENTTISLEIEPDNNSMKLVLPWLQSPVNGTHVEYRIVKVGDLMEILNRRIEPANPLVRDEALLMVAKFSKPEDFPASSGPTIKQICSIYSYLKNGDYPPINGWVYVPDPRGTEYFNYANESVRQGGRSNCTGAGDCDDFAVLMASLVESIGGTSRIVLAYNNSTGGHAYAEVYLGNLRSQSCQVNDIIDWLKKEYNTANIFTYNDTNSGDVWLNLDWGPDENGSAHPGGPFFQAPLKLVLYVNKTSEKTVPELLPARKEEERQSPAAPLKITVDLIENESREFWYNKGNALYELGKYDEAIEAYEQAIRLDPNYAAAWNNRGITLYERGQNDEAIASYNMALGIDPQYPDSLYNKGSVSKRFVPSDYRGDSGDIGLEMSCNESPHSGLECIRIDYSASGSSDARWAGINWVYPAHNYGSLPGLQDVFTGARHLTVWARGMNGGEKAEFGMGGVAGRFSDSVRPAVSTGTVTLSKDWKNYSINLTSKNLSQVICGFYWKTDAISNPSGCTIYLDDIRYEWS
ncbi:tetratricopeptide repeat protein [Methanothrix sp.]